MTTRLAADDPRVEYLTMMGTFYVGQRVIEDGPDAVLSFAQSYVESAKVTAYQNAAVAILNACEIPAAVWSGDSPGMDTRIHVDLGDGSEIGAWVNDGATDWGNTYVQGLDADGGPMPGALGDPWIVDTGRDPAVLAVIIAQAYAATKRLTPG